MKAVIPTHTTVACGWIEWTLQVPQSIAYYTKSLIYIYTSNQYSVSFMRSTISIHFILYELKYFQQQQTRPTFLLSDNTSAPKRSPLRHNLAIGEPCWVSFRCYRGSRDIRDRAERGDISRCWSLLWYWWGKEKMWTCGNKNGDSHLQLWTQ